MGKNKSGKVVKNDAKNDAKNEAKNDIKKEEKKAKNKAGKNDFTAKGRNFLLTQNDVSKSKITIAYLESLKTFRFIIATREAAPKTHHIHDHFFVQFKNSITLSRIGSGGCDLRTSKGTPVDNIAYIYKMKEPWKKGLVYHRKGEPAIFGNLKVKDVLHMTDEDKMELPIQLLKQVNYAQEYMTGPLKASESYKKDLQVIFVYGSSCSLKSKSCYDFIQYLADDVYEKVKYDGHFWLGGFTGRTKVAYYEDFRDTQMPPEEFINFIDYYVQTVNIKNQTYGKNLYTTILFSTIQNPNVIYEKSMTQETRDQWLRRVTVYYFYFCEEDGRYHYRLEDYKGNFANRPDNLVPIFDGITYKKLTGEIKRPEEVQELEAIGYKPKNHFEFYEHFDDLKKKFEEDKAKEKEIKEQEKKKEEVEEEKELVLEKKDKEVKKKKKRRKLKFTQEQLRLKVYCALKQPLDIIPKDENELMRKLIPPDEDEWEEEESDSEDDDE